MEVKRPSPKRRLAQLASVEVNELPSRSIFYEFLTLNSGAIHFFVCSIRAVTTTRVRIEVFLYPTDVNNRPTAGRSDRTGVRTTLASATSCTPT